MGPWSVFISWEAPNGQESNIDEYYLTGDVNVKVPATGKYNFYFAGTNIEPGADVAVSVFAHYRASGQNSTYLTTIGTTPIPRK